LMQITHPKKAVKPEPKYLLQKPKLGPKPQWKCQFCGREYQQDPILISKGEQTLNWTYCANLDCRRVNEFPIEEK
jgi:hypothetical protein